MAAPGRPRFNSLAVRLAAGAAVVLAIGLLAGAFLLSSIFRSSVERSFDDYLTVMLEGLIAETRVAQDGRLRILRGLSDPRFQQPLSGWYWQISTGEGGVVRRSDSLWSERLPVETDSETRWHFYESAGPNDVPLRLLSREIQFPEYDQPFIYVVGGDRAELESEIDAFNTTLAGALAVLFLVLVLAVFLQIRFGLLPLRRIPRALAAIRSGRTDRLTGEFPAEVEPMAQEINALLDHNAQVVERARTHVGNLAHALKTPLSVLTNEASGQDNRFGRMVREQTEAMREQVDHHLTRARAAARAGVLGARTSVTPVLEALKRTLEAIHRERAVTIQLDAPPEAAFLGERQDLEEILGNLMDNACKWAKSRVVVRVAQSDGRLSFRIEDDGPGLSPADRREALKRGTRLDESAPGSGLGLAIVSDIAGMYGGALALEEAAIGGLAAVLTLPGDIGGDAVED